MEACSFCVRMGNVHKSRNKSLRMPKQDLKLSVYAKLRFDRKLPQCDFTALGAPCMFLQVGC
jgi:hypothetical protein